MSTQLADSMAKKKAGISSAPGSVPPGSARALGAPSRDNPMLAMLPEKAPCLSDSGSSSDSDSDSDSSGSSGSSSGSSSDSSGSDSSSSDSESGKLSEDLGNF